MSSVLCISYFFQIKIEYCVLESEFGDRLVLKLASKDYS